MSESFHGIRNERERTRDIREQGRGCVVTSVDATGGDVVVEVAVEPRGQRDVSCLHEIERHGKGIQFFEVALIERDESGDGEASTARIPSEPRQWQNDERVYFKGESVMG